MVVERIDRSAVGGNGEVVEDAVHHPFQMKPLGNRLLHLPRNTLAIGFAIALTGAVQAAEIKLMSSGGMRVALSDLVQRFAGQDTVSDRPPARHR
jgi:hypothetical protein